MCFKATSVLISYAFLILVIFAGGCTSMPPEYMELIKAVDASMLNRPSISDTVQYLVDDEATDKGIFVTVTISDERGDASSKRLRYFQEKDGRLLVCNDLARQASPGLEKSDLYYVD